MVVPPRESYRVCGVEELLWQEVVTTTTIAIPNITVVNAVFFRVFIFAF
jgi:hypothetical protein